MKKTKLIHLMGVLVMLVAVSVGFYYNLGDNHSKSTPDATSHGEQYLSPNDNVTAGTWSAGATIGTKSLAGGSASYIRGDTGWLYYIGGDQDFTGNMTARNEVYNTVTNTWTVKAPCPTTIEYTSGAVLKDTLYIVAGMVNSYFSSETAVVQKYNIRTNTWSTGVSVPQALAGNKAVGYQDSVIICIGGMNAGGSNAVNSVYVFNSNTNTWRTGTVLPAALCSGALTVVGDTLFYIGGGSSYFSGYVNTVYKGVFNATNKATITWTTAAAYSGQNRWRFDAAPWGTKGIIVGAGSTGTTFGSSNECYIMTANTWSAAPNMPQAVGSAGVGSIIYSTGVGKFIVASGEDYPGNPYTVNNCQIYTDTVLVITGISNGNSNNVPKSFALSQNYPNPFNPSTIIEYQLPKSGNVSLVVYDLTGSKVQTLEDGFKQAGSYQISFNASNLSSGVYFYKLTAGDFVSTKKMTLIK